MNPNATRTLWLSIGSAVFAMFLIYSYSQDKQRQYDKQFGATKKVVVAAKDIVEISTINDDMISVEEFPAHYIQPGAVETPEEVVGMVAQASFKKGEQILGNKLLNPGIKTGLSLQVAPERRAVALPVDEVRGVGKLLRPGDRIDILASVETSRGAEKKIEVKTLMQNVIVLSTGLRVTNGIPRVQEGAGGNAYYRNLSEDATFNSITVEATPKQAQDLVYMLTSAPGSLYITLRNPNDNTQPLLTTSNVDSVLGRVSAQIMPAEMRMPTAVAPAPAPAKPVIKKRKGPFIDAN